MRDHAALESLERIEIALGHMIKGLDELLVASRRTASTKQWHSVTEAAVILKRRPYTVREWCRLGRIKATKRLVGRGDVLEWEISHQELERYRNHGLLPIPKRY